MTDHFTPTDEAAAAHAVLPEPAWAFVSGSAGRGTAAAANRAAWDAVRITPRLPVDVSATSTATTLFGAPATAPVAIAPMGGMGVVHPDAEVALAFAAGELGIPLVLSTMASAPIEHVASCGAQWVMQLYPLADKGMQTEVMRRAEDAGASALVLTIDTPHRHGSYYEARTGFVPPEPVIGPATIDPALTWDEVEQITVSTPLPVWIKGVLGQQQAEHALRAGAAGVIVSNHGGRQLDAAPATAHALPAVAARVQEMPVTAGVLVDGGISTGTDVLRALSLGASGVLIGRQVAYALAAGGEPGVVRMLDRIIAELETAMVCVGAASVAEARELR